MELLDASEIVGAVDGQLKTEVEFEIDSVSTDTRQLETGDLFIALIGENFDAHDFLEQAFAQGAKAAIVEAGRDYDLEQPLIEVEDTTKALQDLAAYYLQQFSIPVIAVTGSTGKTTTKDLIAAVVGQRYKTLKTKGNFNNQIGLPLTLLELDSSYQAVVLEMGMRGLGQIARLAEIAQPDIGVITNVGLTHIELLGTVEKIAEAKSELVQSLPSTGLAVLNSDDRRVKEMTDKTTARTIYYGLKEEADLQGVQVETLADDRVRFELVQADENLEIILGMPGEYNVYNALAAIAVGLELDLDLEEISSGLATASLTEKRNQIITTDLGLKIINDTYNANPTSVAAGINTLVKIADGRTIAVLGDMLELGDIAKGEHYRVGSIVVEQEIDYLITIGELATEIARGAADKNNGQTTIFSYQDKLAAIAKLKEIIVSKDTILVKASRGMELEEVVESIT
ncbi:MAG: UDP-N-acetylmuramoyl-tripeptide--D-alanyl-D-alanine ligase [Bacillota bacterium]